MLSDYELLLSLIDASFWEFKVGHIDKHNFLSQLNDQKSNTSQFFLLDDLFLANDIIWSNNHLLS